MSTTSAPSRVTTAWNRTAGLLTLAGGVLLSAATAVELEANVAVDPGPAAAFWVLFLASTLAHVAAMFPLALGRGDGRGAVGASVLGKLALLGFGAFFLANQTMYLVAFYLVPPAAPSPGASAFFFAMSATQGVLLLIGGIIIVKARVLTGAGRWAVLALAILAIVFGLVINTASDPAVIHTMYYVSTAVQVICGILVARAGVSPSK